MMEGPRMIWLQARIRDEPYKPELGATSGSAGRDAILPISLGMVSDDHTVNDLAGLIAKKFDAVHPDKGKLKVKYLQTEYGAVIDASDLVGVHFPRRNGQEPDKPFTVLAIRFPPLPEELPNFARFASVAPESSARPYKRPGDNLLYAAAANRYGYQYHRHTDGLASKRQKLSNGGGEGMFDPDRPMRSRERDPPPIDADLYYLTRSGPSNCIPLDSQQSPKQSHTSTYGTPKSLSTASLNANATNRPNDPSIVPDSPTYRVGPPAGRVLQDAQISQDTPKSESPEQDNIVYSIPPSDPSTPRGHTVSRTEEHTATFLKPSKSTTRTKTPVREIPSAVLSSKKKLVAEQSRRSEGYRVESIGNGRHKTQNDIPALRLASSNGSKALSSYKPSQDVWGVVGPMDENLSRQVARMRGTTASEKQHPTTTNVQLGPRPFSQFNGRSTRSPSINRYIDGSVHSRHGSITDLMDTENSTTDCSTSKVSYPAPVYESIIMDPSPMAVHTFSEEAVVEDSQPLVQDEIKPTESIPNAVRHNQPNDQEIQNNIIAKRDIHNDLGTVKPTIEDGMDVDAEMTSHDEHEGSDINSLDIAQNIEHCTGNSEHNGNEEFMKESETIIVENSSAAKSSKAANTKHAPSTKAFAQSITQKKHTEDLAAEGKVKKAEKKALDRQGKARKATHSKETQEIETLVPTEQPDLSTPPIAKLQRKSITPMIPSHPGPRKSALKSSTSFMPSSISPRGTPSRSMNMDKETPGPSAPQLSPVVASRSVSFDVRPDNVSGTKEAKTQKKPKTKPVTSKTKEQVRRQEIKDLLKQERAMSKETELEKTAPVQAAKAGRKSTEKLQMTLNVTRDKGKKAVYNQPSPPKSIVLARETGFDDRDLPDNNPPLGNQPGPSKSRVISATVPSKPKVGMVPKSPPMFVDVPKLVQAPNADRIGNEAKTVKQPKTDDRLLSRSTSRSPAREVVSSDSSRSDSESDFDSQSESADGEEKEKDGVNGIVKKGLLSTTSSAKPAHQRTPVRTLMNAESASDSETESDDGELPPMTKTSKIQSASESDSQTDDEEDGLTRKSTSSCDGTASRSASVIDEADRQLQRDYRHSMEPSRSSQTNLPLKTPKVAEIVADSQQVKRTNLLSSGTRLPNQRPSLSSIMKGNSSSIVPEKKQLAAYRSPSSKTAAKPSSNTIIDPVPVTRPVNDGSQSSSDEEDEEDDDDPESETMGSQARGIASLFKLNNQGGSHK